MSNPETSPGHSRYVGRLALPRRVTDLLAVVLCTSLIKRLSTRFFRSVRTPLQLTWAMVAISGKKAFKLDNHVSCLSWFYQRGKHWMILFRCPQAPRSLVTGSLFIGC